MHHTREQFACSADPTIVNLLADTVATADYRYLRHHLVASSGNHSGPGEPKLHIRFGLPFGNEAPMVVAGKHIAFDGERYGFGKTVGGFLARQFLAPASAAGVLSPGHRPQERWPGGR